VAPPPSPHEFQSPPEERLELAGRARCLGFADRRLRLLPRAPQVEERRQHVLIESGKSRGGASEDAVPSRRGRGTTLPTSKPIIGAVNGVAVTGGLELALNCDFLIVSERARFADTHARVGVHPLWGLTVLLPQAVGIRRAREMSATGNFVDARTALEWGLVNHVVAHDELLPTARRLAADIVSSDQRAVRAILATYEEASRVPGGEAWDVEARAASEFQRGGVDPDDIERRRQGVVDRGRSQV